jgi:hypothetical protein
MNDLVFSPQAFNEYLEWLTEDKKKNACLLRGSV